MGDDEAATEKDGENAKGCDRDDDADECDGGDNSVTTAMIDSRNAASGRGCNREEHGEVREKIMAGR